MCNRCWEEWRAKDKFHTKVGIKTVTALRSWVRLDQVWFRQSQRTAVLFYRLLFMVHQKFNPITVRSLICRSTLIIINKSSNPCRTSTTMARLCWLKLETQIPDLSNLLFSNKKTCSCWLIWNSSLPINKWLNSNSYSKCTGSTCRCLTSWWPTWVKCLSMENLTKMVFRLSRKKEKTLQVSCKATTDLGF